MQPTDSPRVGVIIPAFNEEKSIGKVVEALPKHWATEIVVVNNGSTDRTAEVARQAGATVLDQPIRGYGNACLKGMAYFEKQVPQIDILAFVDGDFSDHPEELPLLLAPILAGEADFVVGSRTRGNLQKGALTPQQVFGNWLATTLMRWLYGIRYTDLGPFRAIRFDALLGLRMQDPTYGWTVEMQLKAARHQLKTKEVPVSYRPRIGVSKVSGTLKGTLLAGYKILWLIARYGLFKV